MTRENPASPAVIHQTLGEMRSALVQVKKMFPKPGKRNDWLATMVVSEDDLISRVVAKSGATPEEAKRMVALMAALGALDRRVDKNGKNYISAGIGEQG